MPSDRVENLAEVENKKSVLCGKIFEARPNKEQPLNHIL